MNNDRELLELAARAAGLDIQRSRLDDPMHQDFLMNGNGVRNKGQRSYPWNPLNDDGDAFRLSVALDMKVRWHSVLHQALVNSPARKEIVENGENFNGDRYAATRRAITRAAAEIGKAMG